MARVVVTFDDDLETGDVHVVAVPSIGSFGDRVKAHGAESLSGAETMAISAVTKVLQISTQARELQSGIIRPNGGILR